MEDKLTSKSRTGRPRGKRSDATRNQILMTAARQFMELGYDKVSLQEVANLCGVTKATVYHYFKDKGALFTESILRMLRNALARSEEIVQGERELPMRLQKLAEGLLRHSHVEFETMMRKASDVLSEEQIEQVRHQEQQLHILLAGVFQNAMDDGLIKARNAMFLAHAFMMLMLMRNQPELQEGMLTPSEAAGEIVELFLMGLIPRA
ncbi:AcrR family transcriptional regulator [Paenibacillus phyllosphaerae]|uniref:AcrR family transcriptional regulator n=1 Tax=Paenibacillus phyllosphaerae TaxID=274593 RepID=A0A7W5FQQ7_9BACL|nr:TetR/AcrR family transcriptional regulator [Paenibacillus phyllosphaerae]MBB3113548.1 AcrR family transcriptional regulator [Paenibacillus phyllosphaerae]